MADYSYDRTSAKKVPVSQRPLPEQVRYWTSAALSWLKAGAPSSAGKDLRKALDLVEVSPSLRTNSRLRKLLQEAYTAAYGPSPRAADYLVEDALKLLPAKM